MKSELKAKFLQHFVKKNKDGGFTLIELLVVIIIIGILSAIALPAFLNQANKAKQSEAKTSVGSMNRAQQTYVLEKNRFADQDKFGDLGLGIATQSTNYQYKIAGGAKGDTKVTNQALTVEATAPIKTYIGGVKIGAITATSETTTLVKMCEAAKARAVGGADGTQAIDDGAQGEPPACPTDYVEVGQ
jgi:type IV pilus assembly protein PilA